MEKDCSKVNNSNKIKHLYKRDGLFNFFKIFKIKIKNQENNEKVA